MLRRYFNSNRREERGERVSAPKRNIFITALKVIIVIILMHITCNIFFVKVICNEGLPGNCIRIYRLPGTSTRGKFVVI